MRASIRTVARVANLITRPVRPAANAFVKRNFSSAPGSSSFLYTGPVSLVQQQAPSFKATALVNGEFKEISLSDYAGKWVVLFFYPLVS